MKYCLIIATLIVQQCVNALWFPHLTPKAYEKNDVLEVFAGQLWSDRTTLPYDFYKLNWCNSTAGHAYDPDSLGVTMRDTKMVHSPYKYTVGQRRVGAMNTCTQNMTQSQQQQFSFFVQKDYQYRLYLDDLPSATIIRDKDGELKTEY